MLKWLILCSKNCIFLNILFLEGSNFLTQTISVKRPDGRVVILEYNLARWRETLPDLPSLNFDENPSESFQEIKDLVPSVYRKLLDNDGIFNLVLILFPEQKVLKMLVEYFKQQNKTIYQQLASKLAARLLSLR